VSELVARVLSTDPGRYLPRRRFRDLEKWFEGLFSYGSKTQPSSREMPKGGMSKVYRADIPRRYLSEHERPDRVDLRSDMSSQNYGMTILQEEDS
jgi:hypothetical protein